MVTPAPPDLREHQVVFEASSVLEAQMMLNLLQASGIEGQLVGAHLVGGIGELPATNLVKVLVAPESADEARGIIREWESRQEVATPARTTGKAGWIAPFLFGAALSAAFVVWFTCTPASEQGVDLNGDGRSDEQFTYAGDRLVEYDEIGGEVGRSAYAGQP